MRTVLSIFAIVLLALGTYVLSPLFGTKPLAGALSDVILRGAVVLVLVPLGTFYAAHPTSQLDKRKTGRINLLFGCGGIAGVGVILAFASEAYVPGVLSALLSFGFLCLGRKFWLGAVAARVAPILQSPPSPARAVYEEGLRALDQERDPKERRKLELALQKFKDSWRLR